MNVLGTSCLRVLSSKLSSAVCCGLLWAGAVLAAGDAGVGKPESNPVARLLPSTFKLTDRATSGTCFLVEPPAAARGSNGVVILVTANHALEELPGAECQVVMRQELADGGFLRKEIPVTIRAEGKPVWVKHPNEDVAALKLTLPPDVTCQPLRLDQLARAADFSGGRIELGSEAWIFCFPAQLEANAAGFPILRHGSIASLPLPPLANNRTFLVDFNTFGGDSGAPVIIWDRGGKRGDPLVAGMVLGMERQTDKVSMPFEERTVHHPLGLSIVAHAEIIRETVDLLLKE